MDNDCIPNMVDSKHGIRVGIMGAPSSSGNRGVLALGSALAGLCIDSKPGVTVSLLGSSREGGSILMRPHGQPVQIPITHWRMAPNSAPRYHLLVIVLMSVIYRLVPLKWFRNWISGLIPWIGAVRQLTAVGDVRGGDSFSDIYGIKRFLLASLPSWSVILVRGEMVHFPQTYGPFRTRTARMIARFLLKRSSAVVARDKESQQIAQNLVGDVLEVGISPDVAFALHSDRITSFEAEPPIDGALPANTIGINVNGLMFNGGYTRRNMFGLKMDYKAFLTGLVGGMAGATSAEFLLVPHTYAPVGDIESDNDACQQLRQALPPEVRSRVRIVTGEYDAHQLKGIIRQLDFFIGSRMHSCIAALSQGVPCVGVAYSMKFKGVFESVGMEDWVVDGRQVSESQAIERILGLYRSRDDVRAELGASAEAARSRLKEVFANLIHGGHGKAAIARSRDCAEESLVC